MKQGPEKCPKCDYEGKVVDEASGLEAWGKNGKCMRCGHDYGPDELELGDEDQDAWTDDSFFMAYAMEHWIIDVERCSERGTFHRSAKERMRGRWQGWNAALRAVREASLRAAGQ